MLKINPIFFILHFFLCSSQLILSEEFSEELCVRRIRAHLILQDKISAEKEASRSSLQYSDSKKILEESIRASSRNGMEFKSIKLWKNYILQFPNENINRELIEEMAWGILNKASQSNSLIMRQMALLAAGFSREGKGMNILYAGMKDSNHAIRELAVKLSGHYRDKKLQDEMIRLFYEEKSWKVRRQVIESIGLMEMTFVQPQLEEVLASDDFQSNEKKAAIASLLSLHDTLKESEINRLTIHSRAEFRCLACQAIAQYQLYKYIDNLFILIKDPNPDVRREAFQAIGVLRPTNEIEKILQCCHEGIKDRNPYVVLTATWLLTLYKPEESLSSFNILLNHPFHEIRLMASSVLAHTGIYGINQMQWYFKHHSDPFVKLNLALGLIGQRVDVTITSTYLREMLLQNKEKWGTFKMGIFEAITNNSVLFSKEESSHSELENQLLKLECLNLLAILKDPLAQDAIRNFLNERIWGVTGAASAFLLTEGDETAIDIVKNLLEDSKKGIRIQAALILSLWGKEECAIKTLKEGYWTSDFETKGKILESLGRIGSDEIIPFLMEVWSEPSQTLRVISAMAVIQCLYH